ncbi:MAG: hypothetical protein JNG90_11125, partial [Planctomycetaceae bacterium]|nr:hypothetical protein [Planctomycetaceae bacterium]
MSLTQLWPHPAASVLMPPKEAPHGSPAQARDLCEAAFGVPFAILNGSTGELLLHSPDQPARDWELRGALAQEVSRRGRPELIEEGGPLVTLAIPLVTSRTSDYVAVGALLTRPLSSSPADLREASELLGLEPEEARTWIDRQRPCPVEVMARLAELVHDKHFAQLHVDRLETENALLVERLATSCDEVSLLYCLIQNLRVTADDDQLARMAL